MPKTNKAFHDCSPSRLLKALSRLKDFPIGGGSTHALALPSPDWRVPAGPLPLLSQPLVSLRTALCIKDRAVKSLTSELRGNLWQPVTKQSSCVHARQISPLPERDFSLRNKLSNPVIWRLFNSKLEARPLSQYRFQAPD
jgi:hypothetical protein